MIKLAKILEINSDNVLLKLEQKTQCSDCENRCSDGFLGFLFHKNDTNIMTVALRKKDAAKNHIVDEQHFFNSGSQIDEVVGLNFDESRLFKMALLLYGLPILFIVVFLTLGYWIFINLNLNADLGGISGFLLGLWWAKHFIHLANRNFKPKVKFFN